MASCSAAAAVASAWVSPAASTGEYRRATAPRRCTVRQPFSTLDRA